jgi:hypothetical protein
VLEQPQRSPSPSTNDIAIADALRTSGALDTQSEANMSDDHKIRVRVTAETLSALHAHRRDPSRSSVILGDSGYAIW